MDEAETLPTLSGLFGALANADRLAILRELVSCVPTDDASEPDTSISALAERTGLTRFAASRHLSVLREVRLIEVTKVGYRKVHALRVDAFQPIEDWLLDIIDAVG